jgi:hypothetical protein
VMNEIVIAHPECLVILVKLRIEYLLDVRSPEVASSAPGTVPLKEAPQVSDID